MISRLKRLDSFSRNIIIYFLATSAVNFFNLLYQLLIAHQTTPQDFASFNALLSILMIVATPLVTLNMGLTKYVSELHGKKEEHTIKVMLSGTLRLMIFMAVAVFALFWAGSELLKDALKISSIGPCYILALLVAVTCLLPVFIGAAQGFELFGWLAGISIITGLVKLGSAFILLNFGTGATGALLALFLANILTLVLAYFPVRKYFQPGLEGSYSYGSLLRYMLPVAISSFCFIQASSFDIVMIKYYFSPEASGNYAVAQMVGKIFLFLPGAISLVMFPRTSRESASQKDSRMTFRRSLFYTVALCAFAALIYNLYPEFVLKVLTGKVTQEAVLLGRLFSFSMGFFALVNIFSAYFLSIRDFRFLWFMAFGTITQFILIAMYHPSLSMVQAIMCVNALALTLIFCGIHFFKGGNKQ